MDQEIIDYVYGLEIRGLDDDGKQDLLLHLVENMPEQGLDKAKHYIQRALKHDRIDAKAQANNRARLEAEHEQDIRDNFHSNGEENRDPLAVLMDEEHAEQNLSKLSPLLRRTVERVYLEGYSILDVAGEDGMDPHAIEQRLYNARRIINE